MTYESPTPERINQFLKDNQLTQGQAAELAGLSSGAAFRKYLGGKEPRKMSYGVWFVLNAKVQLSKSNIDRIHAAMR